MDASDSDSRSGDESADGDSAPSEVAATADARGSTDSTVDGADARDQPDGGVDVGESDGGVDVGESDGGVEGGESDGGVEGGESDGGVEGGESDGGADESTPEPTPQSAALRRQQVYVGAGGALVAGGALAVVTFQQFTDSPALAVLVGLAGTALVLWLVRKSIFPGKPAAE